MNAIIQLEPITSSGKVTIQAGDAVHAVKPSKAVTDSVLQYIKAVRRLGRTTVSTRDIADALSLSHDEVLAAARALKEHGVRGL